MIDYKVYIVLNKVNNKKYIGSTKQTLAKRFNNHVSDSNNKKRRKTRGLARAIHKYSPSDFVIEQLCCFDNLEDCLKEESRLIHFYDTVKNGYNMISKGFCAKTKSKKDKKTKEWKLKMSEIRKTKWKDPESRKKMIEGRWGNYKKAKKYKKPKMSKEEKIKSIVESNIRRSKNYTFISPEGKEFNVNHLPSFCDKMNLDSSCMNRVHNGVNKTHKGWSRKAWNCN